VSVLRNIPDEPTALDVLRQGRAAFLDDDNRCVFCKRITRHTIIFDKDDEDKIVALVADGESFCWKRQDYDFEDML